MDGGIDGLVHLSDISWNEPGEEAVRRFSKGDEIETVILAVDAERERISLGIKQLERDPFSEFLEMNDRGSIVKGRVVEVNASEATVELAEEVLGVLKASEIDLNRVDDATKVLEVEQEVEAKIIGVDRKSRTISLSIKAKDEQEEREAVKDHQRQESERSGPATLGDLIKAQMDQPSEDK